MQQQRTTAQGVTKTMPVHHFILEERKKLTVTGVLKVLNCDEYGALMETPVGRLQIVGQGLSVSELSMETGEVRVNGEIAELTYSAVSEGAGGFFRRFLR
ncbi:MAG: YabP/YqfC family sporulation protein [Faecalibacterium sp.]